LGDCAWINGGIRARCAFPDDSRKGTTSLGNFDSPPLRQGGKRRVEMSLGTDHRQPVEHLAVGQDLAGEPRQAVALALDLEAFEAPVNQSHIYPALTGQNAHLVDDPRARIAAVP
jgi:hypothetical protein